MRFGRSIVIIAAFVALTAGAAACGGGGDGKLATPTAFSITTRASGDVTPFPTPQVTGNAIVSPTKGYSASFPDGWKFHANLVQTADASVDAIFEPLTPGANVQANISANCIVERAGQSEEERVSFQKTNTLRQGLNKDIQVSQMKFAGMDATVLSYRFVSQTAGTPELDKQDILFASPKCAWIVTTTAPAGQRPKYQADFDIFLNTFKLIS